MTLGVLGTMVWDRIDHPDGETVERWGGISYSLAAAAAALPDGWTLRPIIRLGADLAEAGRRFLASVPHLERPGAVVEVDEPNNRVHLRYRDRHHRDEHLTGGVSAWEGPELEPHLEALDGLYVNMISGFELELDTVRDLRDRFRRPRYVDLHSLVLGVGDDGRRVPRRPTRAASWLGAFHVVQANETELEIMAGDGTAEEAARCALRDGARAVLVTRGPRGAGWLARSDRPLWLETGNAGAGGAGGAEIAWSGPQNGESTPAGDGVRAGEVALEEDRSAGDPTGCGDVWGATCFVHLMAGRRLPDAMDAANRAAARNVEHRGADGLYGHLRGAA